MLMRLSIWSCLDICAAGEENRQSLLNLGAVERLLKHIMSEDKLIRKNATMCLGTMSQNGKKNIFNLSLLQGHGSILDAAKNEKSLDQLICQFSSDKLWKKLCWHLSFSFPS